MKKKPIDYYSEENFMPVIEIGEHNIEAHYYNNMSGEIGISNKDGEQIFFKDDGRLKHHIKYLEEAIEDLQESFKENIKNYKKAISLLKKEQIKFKNKTKCKK